MNIVEKKNTQLNDNLIKLLNENTDIIELIAKHKDMLNDILNNNVKNFEVQKIREGYTCQPKLKEQLQDIIIERIETYGLDCNLNDIDVSKIKDMSNLFNADTTYGGNDIFKYFNGDISKWDVSNVENMESMFLDCKNFNGDISGWNVSNVTDMKCMFLGCENFNQDISNWNVANVEDMKAMFAGCETFNRDISKWNVSNVENMDRMFWYCKSFRQNLDKWDVSNVNDMYRMFYECPTKPKWYNMQ